ncbi:MAG: hypothetical protein NC432_08695 [Roseburia sp.]|nr:hypothetical protein [Roseburia sp.]MCM1097809.1 hypothetical protein [Ruminococcus flavefaciens]
MEYTQVTLEEWMQWKEEIREKLSETAGNFVYIGYRLKQIRDSGRYGGAADVFGFAEKEYGLGKSTVSRFIAINEKYSEGGNSLELKEEYKNFSSSKLAEMLTLPDSELGLITEQTTIREIRELKSFRAEEEREYPQEEIPGQASIGDYPGVVPGAGSPREERRIGEGDAEKQGAAGREAIESQSAEAELREPEEDGTEAAETPLGKCLVDFFREKKEVFDTVMRYLEEEEPDYKGAAEQMAPSGQASHRKGIVFLFLYGWAEGVKYREMGKPKPVAMTWPVLLELVREIYRDYRKPGFWERLYGENPVATSQQPGEAAEEKPGTDREPGGKRPTETREGKSRETLEIQGAEASGSGTKPAENGIEEEKSLSLEEEKPTIIPGTGAVEIKDEGEEDGESSGTDGGEAAGGDAPAAGEPEDAPAAGGPGGVQGTDREEDPEAAASGVPVGEPDAGAGAAEGGGRAGDSGETELPLEEEIAKIFSEMKFLLEELNYFRVIYQGSDLSDLEDIPPGRLEEAYRKAVSLAADLERLLILREKLRMTRGGQL